MAHGAIAYAMPGTDTSRENRTFPTNRCSSGNGHCKTPELLHHRRYEPTRFATRYPVLTSRMALLSAFALAMRCPWVSLRACYAMSGTDIAYDAISGIDSYVHTHWLSRVSGAAYAMSGTGMVYGVRSAYELARRPVQAKRMVVPLCSSFYTISLNTSDEISGTNCA
eukprot:106427-Rhodomonas_salina.1